MEQQTFEKEFKISGIGLHSGVQSTLHFIPQKEETGIVFSKGTEKVQALFSNVADTRNCTALGLKGGVIATIEHLMAALYIKGVDNLLIVTDSPELPILDGSALMWYEHFSQINLQPCHNQKKYLKVVKPVTFADDNGNFVSLLPPTTDEMFVHFEIDFPSKIVGHQVFHGPVTEQVFKEQIAPCRTFCEKYQIEYLQSIGLIKGGSLENAVVLDGDKILNPGGFKVQNECVNHKVLDLIGDMFTSGYYILADIKAQRTGHFHNNMVLKKLFEDPSNFEIL